MAMKKGNNPTTTGKIQSVTITWCKKNGEQREMQLDLSTAKGILWAYDPGSPVVDLPSVQNKRPFPPKGPSKKIGPCTPLVPQEHFSEGPSCCWWDGVSWVCPEDPE